MNRSKRLWKEWKVVFYIVAFMLIFRSAIANWYVVPTGSMKPTLVEGDYILADILAYQIKLPFSNKVIARWDTPRAGDVVVFESPQGNKRLVKRVIGLPGDTLSMRNNRVFINGQKTDYSLQGQSAVAMYWKGEARPPFLLEEQLGDTPHPIAIQFDDYTSYQNFGPLTVPDKHYFVLGDNRDNSADSRRFGMVHEDLIDGKAKMVLLSFNIKENYQLRRERSFSSLQ
ncbi:MAG: signal peptidase I [Gammaproteobacteria bacterium]|nr:signal peptidase I [Gammaproteobacteria bacterium]